MTWPKDLQMVNVIKNKERCKRCGTNILDIANFKYSNKFFSTPNYREELCECKNCGTPFILRYNLFDEDGHVYRRVFSGDINNPKYNWQDNLTEEQIKTIAEHLESCQICARRLSEEMLSDAWLASVVHRRK